MIWWTQLRKELLEQWRTYRLLVLGVILLIMGLGSPLLAKFTPELIRLVPGGEQFVPLIPPPTSADAVVQYLKNVGQFGILLALILNMGAVAQEKDKGTAALMLVKPLPRSVYLGAKFLAMALIFGVTLLLAGLSAYYYTWLLFEAPDLGGWLTMNALLWLYLFVYVSLTLFASAISRTQTVAGGISFGLLILLSLIGALPGLGQYLPGQLLTWGGQAATVGGPASWAAVWISLGLIALSFVGGWIVLERQEL